MEISSTKAPEILDDHYNYFSLTFLTFVNEAIINIQYQYIL